MGFRFRKMWRGGPFHWTLSKSGMGWSVGFPGCRYGIGGHGRRYISFGIPGTGLYWFKYLPNRRSQQPTYAAPAPPQPQVPTQQNTSGGLPQPQSGQTAPTTTK